MNRSIKVRVLKNGSLIQNRENESKRMKWPEPGYIYRKISLKGVTLRATTGKKRYAQLRDTHENLALICEFACGGHGIGSAGGTNARKSTSVQPMNLVSF